MLFNSHVFIFVFLPITGLVFFMLSGRKQHGLACAWLVGASLFYYCWWNPAYIALILFSTLFNYAVGLVLSENSLIGKNKKVLCFGIIANLSLLGYFKYVNFFVDNFNRAIGTSFHLDTIILPLAISFFTFQQIAYLVDTYRGEVKEHSFLHYCLFVSFFPQLIAGPIVHHREMMSQFDRKEIYKFDYENLAVGMTIFFIGLFKKVVIADGMAQYATPVFGLASNGVNPLILEAWAGAIAYTFQIYFDFSGYSDMAIGLGRIFGIKLPLNFYSPYKATSIIDFWRRWHITLSRFLKDYLYIVLGGNRKGKLRRHANILLTMLIGGLWHGAGWTFVFWGAMHGVAIVLNHMWRNFKKRVGINKESKVGNAMSCVVTFFFCVVCWVFFRAENLNSAVIILKSMFGFNEFIVPHYLSGIANKMSWLGVRAEDVLNIIHVRNFIIFGLLISVIVWVMPNTQQFMCKYHPSFDIFKGKKLNSFSDKIQWKPNLIWMLITSIIAAISILYISRASEFIYFNF